MKTFTFTKMHCLILIVIKMTSNIHGKKSPFLNIVEMLENQISIHI